MGDWESSFLVQASAPMLVAENPVIIDDSGDGVWDAEESAVLQVDLANYGTADFFDYPGATLTINSPFVTETDADGNIFYGIVVFLDQCINHICIGWCYS